MIFNGIDLGTYNVAKSKKEINSIIDQYKDNRGKFRKLLHPYTGFDVRSSKGKLDIKNSENNIKIRIAPMFSSGIFYFAEMYFMDETTNSCKVNFRLSIGTGLLVTLAVLSFVCPVILTPLILSTDHYYQTVNGITTIVHGRPYFGFIILGIMLFFWWTYVLVLLNKYKNKYKEFISNNLNVQFTK